MKILLSLILVYGLMVGLIYSEEEGPFGLKWGMKKAQVEALGIVFESNSSAEVSSLEVLKTKQLPKNLSISESYVLVFSETYGLQKVKVISKTITNDIYGIEGKRTFSNLKEGLTKKYGQPTTGMESVGNKLWKNADEFYQCLDYDGCGMWIAIFEETSSGVSVALELKGLERGRGYITLRYEGPKWSNIVDSAKSKKSATDEDAL